MELIKWKLELITNTWNDYFWEYKYLQKKINFDSDVKTNYYGDILAYFQDTFDLLTTSESKKFGNNVFHYIGILQIMYVHQDLIDELLYIFKLEEATLVDKNPIRNLRNELIGHPIRRSKEKGNSLLSSVIFSNNTTNKTLEYLKYAKSNNFKMEVVNYNIDLILENHKKFLTKYFDVILNKICKILISYKKELIKFEANVLNNINFEKVINQIQILFEYILRFNYLYKKEILIECFNRQTEHERYRFVKDLFLKELSRHLEESKRNISEFIQEKESGPKKYDTIKVAILDEEYIDAPKSPNIKVAVSKKTKTDFNYSLGKLHGKDFVFGIEYFKNIFKTNKKVLAELINMENNFNNTLEYYSSYEYLRKLILGKKYDR